MNLAFEVDLLSDESPAKKTEARFYMHRGALKRNLIDDLWKRKAATSAPALAQVLLSEPVLDAVRMAIRTASKYSPDTDELARILRSEVIRSELLLR